jgi:REase_MTES_1575
MGENVAEISGRGCVPEATALVKDWLSELQEQAQRHLSLCDSPIEQIFLAEVIHQGEWGLPAASRSVCYALAGWKSPVEKARGWLNSNRSTLWVQPEVRPAKDLYRLDFAVIGGEYSVAVELDGHDFHERTPAQAARDRSRDRALTLAGWVVLRFTGSEIVRDPFEAVRQVARACWP